MNIINSKQAWDKTVSRRGILKYGLYGGLVASLTPALWVSGCGKRAGKKPNIILIIVDTVRVDHLGCYGYQKNTSPNIDRFASDGLLFENCYAQGAETWGSVASILTGFLPHETKIFNTRRVPDKIPMISESLQRIGYKTIAVVSNYVLQKKWGWDQGFTIYDDIQNDRELVRAIPERIAERSTERAIELLEQFYKDPLFMWIHYQDPHGPYTPPGRFAELFTNPDQKPRELRVNQSELGNGGIPSYQKLGSNRDYYHYVSQYDGEIRYTDENIKHLIDALKKNGMYDNSLLLFTSDHGEEMGEHNNFFVHGSSLYNSLTHVPLIIKYGTELTGRRKEFVQLLDVVPTLTETVGLDVDQRFRGSNLLRQGKRSKEIISELNVPREAGGQKISIVSEGFKLICSSLSPQFQFFDLKTDPHEQCDLISDNNHKERISDLITRVKRIGNEDFLRLGEVEKSYKLTEDEIKKLKTLGYTQ